MNYEVIASPAARAISGKKSFRCDLCWPEARLDVEYQSRENHEGELSRIRDSRRANALAAMGWTVLGVTNDELNSLAATDAVAEAIRRHLGKRLRTNVSDWHARKLRLRRRLGLPWDTRRRSDRVANCDAGGALLVGCGCAASHLELSAGVRRCSEPRCFWQKVAEFGNHKTD